MGTLILGYDLETGASFDTPKDQNFITEIGAVLWDVDAGMPVKIYNTLINNPNKTISDDCIQYTGITDHQCDKFGVPLGVAIKEFECMMDLADYSMAHNGRNFDEEVLKGVYHREEAFPSFTPKPLIDTMTDLPFPANCKSRNLTYLAGFHLILNSFPHRAVTDVLTMLAVFNKYDWMEVEEIVNSPIVTYVAQFNYPNERRLGAGFKKAMVEFNEIKDGVKNLGFKWNPDTKTWTLQTREALIKGVEFPCPVKILN